MQALNFGEKFERERLHHEEITTAQLASLLYRFNVTKPPFRTTEEFCFFRSKEYQYSESLCNTFYSLLNDQKIASWAIAELPVDEFEAGVTDEIPTTPRAFIARGILFLCPQVINEEWIQAEIACFDGSIKPGVHIVIDVDTREAYRISIPSDARNIEHHYVVEIATQIGMVQG